MTWLNFKHGTPKKVQCDNNFATPHLTPPRPPPRPHTPSSVLSR